MAQFVFTVFSAAMMIVGVALGYGLHDQKVRSWTMKDFCGNGFYWACDLHPDCTAIAIHCFPKLTLQRERGIQNALEKSTRD